jgi:hypothetical protein
MTNQAAIKKIMQTVEIVAERQHNTWAIGAGHPQQKWPMIEKWAKDLWRSRVTVQDICSELDD